MDDYFIRDGRKVPRIVETSVSRLLTHFDKTGFAVLTAYRGEKTKEENEANLAELKSKVRASGYSFIPIIGKGREQHPDGTETIASEPSIFIPDKPRYDDVQDLRDLVVKLGNDYNQTSVLYKPKDGPVVEIKCSNGEILRTMPSFGAKEWADFWTQIVRGSKSQKDVKVVFESVFYQIGNPESFIEGMSRQADGEIFSIETFLKTPVRSINKAIDQLLK
jgi:hypothetical protein